MKLARRSLFQGVCGALLGRVLPESAAERAAAHMGAGIEVLRDRVFMPAHQCYFFLSQQALDYLLADPEFAHHGDKS